MVEILHKASNNISIDFILILSTNLLMVEIVDIVDVFSYNFYDYVYISIFESR
jgi:hypothetical protein